MKVDEALANHAVDSRLAIERAKAVLTMSMMMPERIAPSEAVSGALRELQDIETVALVMRQVDVEVEVPAREPIMIGELSAREVQIGRLLSEGLTKPEIAEHLTLSTHTIHTHVGRLRHKLSTATAAGVVGRMYRLGLMNGEK